MLFTIDVAKESFTYMKSGEMNSTEWDRYSGMYKRFVDKIKKVLYDEDTFNEFDRCVSVVREDLNAHRVYMEDSDIHLFVKKCIELLKDKSFLY